MLLWRFIRWGGGVGRDFIYISVVKIISLKVSKVLFQHIFKVWQLTTRHDNMYVCTRNMFRLQNDNGLGIQEKYSYCLTGITIYA